MNRRVIMLSRVIELYPPSKVTEISDRVKFMRLFTTYTTAGEPFSDDSDTVTGPVNYTYPEEDWDIISEFVAAWLEHIAKQVQQHMPLDDYNGMAVMTTTVDDMSEVTEFTRIHPIGMNTKTREVTYHMTVICHDA